MLVALRTKGETVDELVGLATTMRAFATPGDDRPRRPDRHRRHRRRPADVQRLHDRRADRRRPRLRGGQARQPQRDRPVRAPPTCWRRSASASTSSPTPSPAVSPRSGFGFMFAPAHHGATRFVVPVRKELAVRTIFNFLGPLTNPAGALRQVIGVSDPSFLETIAGALARLGAAEGAGSVQRRRSGRDEHVGDNARRRGRRRAATRHTTSPPRTWGSRVPSRRRCPAARRTSTPRRPGGSSPARTGPARDVAVLNAGAAIYVSGTVDCLEAGVRAAEAAIDDGRATAALDALVNLTQELRRMSVLGPDRRRHPRRGQAAAQVDAAGRARVACSSAAPRASARSPRRSRARASR